MRAYIFGGGDVSVGHLSDVLAFPEADDRIIAADSGYKNALDFGIERIDTLIGDFDSIGLDVNCLPDNVREILQVPVEKDCTDLQLAVETAIQSGADELVIVASTDGRLDHTLSSLAILERLYNVKKGPRVNAYMINGKNRIRYIKNSSHIILRSKYSYFGLIAADEKAVGVSVEGAKYPLKKKTLHRREQFAVSNEIQGNCALVSVSKGGIYIIESRDI